MVGNSESGPLPNSENRRTSIESLIRVLPEMALSKNGRITAAAASVEMRRDTRVIPAQETVDELMQRIETLAYDS